MVFLSVRPFSFGWQSVVGQLLYYKPSKVFVMEKDPPSRPSMVVFNTKRPPDPKDSWSFSLSDTNMSFPIITATATAASSSFQQQQQLRNTINTKRPPDVDSESTFFSFNNHINSQTAPSAAHSASQAIVMLHQQQHSTPSFCWSVRPISVLPSHLLIEQH